MLLSEESDCLWYLYSLEHAPPESGVHRPLLEELVPREKKKAVRALDSLHPRLSHSSI